MKTVYCISGLGADQRIFSGLQIPGVSLHFVEWLQPEPGEPLEAYARRMSQQIRNANPIILGVSFGGILAIEISKIISVEKLVLIASVKSHRELPGWMKAVGKLKLDRILPSNRPIQSIRPIRALRPIQNFFLGVQNDEEKRIANEYRDKVDPVYLKWSIQQVLHWKNDWNPENVYHIHGDRDKIFPLRNVHPTHVISHAGHFMVMNKCKEISEILNSILEPY
jgi:hypothetical protein